MEFYPFYVDNRKPFSFLAEKVTYLHGMGFCHICGDRVA